MKIKNKKRIKGMPPCDELREDDGIPPWDSKKKSHHKGKPDYQNSRMCKQVETVLSLIFSGGGGDSRFTGLFVDSVTPLSDLAYLMITVMPLYRECASDPDMIIQFLESAKPFLRKEVAYEINRKRMPDFKFRVMIDPEKFIN